MAIQWKEDLSTGSVKIDNQHKEIFRRINGLLDACNEGKGKTEVCGVIDFIDDYIVTHFGEEEKYMVAHGYPGYAEHKKEHEKFIKNFLALKKQVDTDGPGVHTVIATNQMVVAWFLDHIRKVDKQLGAFMKTKL